MSLYVYPAWDFARIGTMTFTVDDTGPPHNYTVSITSGVYSHVTYASVVSTVLPFAAALKTAMDAAAAGAGSSITYTVTYTEATRGYTITPSSGTVKLTFGATAAGTVAKHVLGFSGTMSAAASAVSDVGVYYALAGAEGAQMDVYEYEAPDSGDVGEADDGSTYMTARTTAPVYYDCTIPYEPRAIVYTYALAAANPWTWQMFFAHVRTANYHYAMKDSGTAQTTVHRSRKDGMAFAPEMVSGDKAYQAYLHIPLRTYLIGRV